MHHQPMFRLLADNRKAGFFRAEAEFWGGVSAERFVKDQNPARLADWVTAGTWFTAQEAVDYGSAILDRKSAQAGKHPARYPSHTRFHRAVGVGRAYWCLRVNEKPFHSL